MVAVDRLTSMTVFAKVATTRSFSGAARELGISQATASKHVQTLEDWLGVRLLHRTTRRVALTDAGEGFFVQCLRILEDMEAARSSAKPEAPVRGNMRITAPVVFGSTRLGPLVVDFMHQHPELDFIEKCTGSAADEAMKDGFVTEHLIGTLKGEPELSEVTEGAPASPHVGPVEQLEAI